MNKGFQSYFIILPIFSFISLALDFNLLVRWLGSGVAFVFQICISIIIKRINQFLVCTLGSICMFTVNKGSYWLFVPYIMIPAFDILRTLFQSTMRTKCDSSMYFEQLLPTFFLIVISLPRAYLLK